MWNVFRRSLLLMTVLGCCPLSTFAQQYQSFREAMAAGSVHLTARNYAASQAPFEAALALAKDDLQKMQAYDALRPAYRQLPDIAKMTEAYEFIAAHADSTPRRSLLATDYASFVHQRGKSQEAIERYEARLKKDPDDLPALSLLSVLYQRVRDDKRSRGEELAARLKRLNSEIAVKKAEKLEADAEIDQKTTAWTWKNAAQSWLEAGDLPRAKQAAERSAKAAPEGRTTILALQWREGLGDVFAATGDTKQAAEQYREAVGVAPAGILKKNVEEKLAKAEGGTKR